MNKTISITTYNENFEPVNKLFNIELKNVKDNNYFYKGMTFYSLSKTYNEISDKKSAFVSAKTAIIDSDYSGVSELANNANDTRIIILNENITECEKIMSEIMDKITNEFSINDDDKTLFQNDKFLKLVATSCGLCRETLEGWNEVNDALKTYYAATIDTDKPAKNEYITYKTALEKCANQFCTRESEYYSKYTMRVNHSICKAVYCKSYGGSKIKDGNVKHGKYNAKAAHKECLLQLVGRLQGSISEE